MRVTLLIVIILVSITDVKAQSDSVSIDTSVVPVISKEEYYNRGLVFYNASQYPQAIVMLDSCLQKEPKFTHALYLKALSLEKQGNLKEAATIFGQIKIIDPSYDEVDKHLRNYYITTYISRNWYYMLAMLLITVLIFGLVARSVNYRKL